MVGGCLLPACQFQSTHRFQRPRTKSRLHFPYLTGNLFPFPSPSFAELGASHKYHVPPFTQSPSGGYHVYAYAYTGVWKVYSKRIHPSPPLVLGACLVRKNQGLSRTVLHVAAIWQNVWEGPILKIVKKESKWKIKPWVQMWHIKIPTVAHVRQYILYSSKHLNFSMFVSYIFISNCDIPVLK